MGEGIAHSARELRRDTLREQRQRQRQRRQRHTRWRKGQTLIIFALSITVLLSIAGLVVDVARAYDLFARMQRAAEAGAAAGVLYLPNYYSTARTPGDGLSAVNRATVEIVKNGYGSAIAVGQSDCPTPVTSVGVAVCQVTNQPNDLEVFITERLSLVLLNGLGVAPITLTAKAQSEYMPPVQLGARSNYFGDEVECSTSNPPDPTNATPCDVGSTLQGNHLQYFMATINGPAEMKEHGDPMVYCEEGNSHISALDGSANSYTAYNGFTTNHPQWSSSASVIQQHCGPPVLGGNPGNPDQQPPLYDGPATDGTAHPGGYNYAIAVPTNNASIWVFNPTYIPSSQNFFTNAPGSGLDLFFNQLFGNYPSMKDPNGGGISAINGSGNFDAPPLYFTMTYTLYSVTNVYDRGADTRVVSQAYPPYDAISADLSRHSCGSGQVYDPYWSGSTTPNAYHGTITSFGSSGGCFTLAPKTQGSASPWEASATAPCWLAWCKIASNVPQGTYRLVVEATGLNSNVAEYHSNSTDGWGTHYYALKICATNSYADPIGTHCPTGAGPGNPGVSLSAWANMDFNFTTTLSNAAASQSNPATSCVSGAITTSYACLDLACIPAAYAGRTLSAGLYDPGDGDQGDIYIGIVPPAGSGATVTYPSWATTSTIDGESVTHARFSTPTNYNALNGLWLNATISLPPSYSGTCLPNGGTSTGWFQIVYASSNGSKPIDWVGVSFTLIGSPVHLVPPA